MIYKSTPDEQHPSNATSNSILVNKMAKVPLISNTFLGVATGAFLGQSLGLLQTSGQSRTCLALASANEQLPPCGGVQAMFGLVFWLLVPHKCKRAEPVAWHAPNSKLSKTKATLEIPSPATPPLEQHFSFCKMGCCSSGVLLYTLPSTIAICLGAYLIQSHLNTYPWF